MLLALSLGVASSAIAAAPQGMGSGDQDPDLGPIEGISGRDWASLRAAYQAGQHAVRMVDGALQAHNPGQGWTTRFDEDGALTTPSSGDWSWGLSLASWGFAGAVVDVEDPRDVTSDGNKVTLDWGPELSEWWINDNRGIEHGFTVHSRPDGENTHRGAHLRFGLSVQGSLAPSVAAGRRDVCFVDESGVAAMTYSGLVAFDADGCALPAWIDSQSIGDDHQLFICVQDAGARYPVTIDPLSQSAYLKASNSGNSDSFGSSIAISGDTVVVGARGESSDATGVNGDESNDNTQWAGAAYVFVRTGATWSQQAYLKASNPDRRDYFGCAVSISGDTVVVGAFGEDSDSTGVNGDDSSNAADSTGAAYVFVRTGTTWQQQAYLKPPVSDGGLDFGTSVAVLGDRVLVGSPRDSSTATGINGNPNSTGVTHSGAVISFIRSGSTWSQEAYIKASNPSTYAELGSSVAMSGSTLVVGAAREESNARGVDGVQTASGLRDEGAAYVFFHDGTSWTQQAYLKSTLPLPGRGKFGTSVSVSGDRVIIGAPEEQDGLLASGSAYVFSRTGATWAPEAQLKASNPGDGDQFGSSVAILGRAIAVGAQLEASDASGFNGDETNDVHPESGACYVFALVGSRWLHQDYVKASNSGAFDRFGSSVCLSNSTLLVGAVDEGSNATGVNGDQSNNSENGSGAAYVIDLAAPGTFGVNFCRPFVLNSSNTHATITATGSNVVSANNLTLTVNGLPAAGTTAMLIATKQPTVTLPSPMGSNGRLCIGSSKLGRDAANVYMGNAGTFSRALNLTSIPYPESAGVSRATVLAGDTWYWQCWYRDGSQSNFSGAIGVTFL